MIVLVAGTRPEAVKLAPVVWALNQLDQDFTFVWSGQHYDYEMSKIFFRELNLPEPDFNLDVREKTQGTQVAHILMGIENIVKKSSDCGIIVAEGDTNTVLGAALASVKSGWLFGHIEAGLRSFSRIMPEEINRVIADSIANIHFSPSVNSVLNLLYEGVIPWRIHLTGNTIVDTVNRVLPDIKKRGNKIVEEMGIKENFGLVTLHRAENVDNPRRLKNILSALKTISKDLTLIFPVHPRTRKRLIEYKLLRFIEKSNICLVRPIGYFDFLGLLSKSEIIFTDSGGVQEEALIIGVPCITLRYNTERPETVWKGGNFLVGDDYEEIVRTAKCVVNNRDEILEKIGKGENPYGDGKAGERIARTLKELDQDKEVFKRYAYVEPDFRYHFDPTFRMIEGVAYTGMRIKDFKEEYKGTFVTLIYDEYGNPLIPFDDRIIESSWVLRIWGPRKLLDRYFGETFYGK